MAIALLQNSPQPTWIKGLVLSGSPALRAIAEAQKPWQQRLVWNLLFDSPLGNAFYRYPRRRQFLQSFSERQRRRFLVVM